MSVSRKEHQQDQELCLVRLIFSRHGETVYTGKYPDLTPKGEKTIKATAQTVRKYIAGDVISVMCTPTPRTRATVDILCRELRISKHVDTCTGLAPMQIYDMPRCQAGFDKLRMRTSTANPYPVETAYLLQKGIFADHSAIESKASVDMRSLIWLKRFVDWCIDARRRAQDDEDHPLMGSSRPKATVIIGHHFETITPFVVGMHPHRFDLEPVRHGEVQVIDVSTGGNDNFRARSIFRGESIVSRFCKQKHQFEDHHVVPPVVH